MLKVSNLYAGYNGADVIFDINFEVQRGESLCVLGPNGCGKSTLLKSIARIIDFKGKVLIDGDDSSNLPRKELAKKIALLSQSSQVFFPYTVYETVSMGRYAWSDENIDIIEETLKKLDIYDIKDRNIDELSGGTLQRVFLARAFAQTPDIILLDEPANHLDLKYQIELLGFLKSWVKENKKAMIGVFHDLNMARQFGDKTIVMNDGKIAARTDIGEVLSGEVLNTVYGVDIRSFIIKSLEMWK
ncbi:MAG: ABC transporter ATP-binding protein [Treponema sp.]|nr:ABC transporter ATP-binding protein [Treponema sp.]